MCQWILSAVVEAATAGAGRSGGSCGSGGGGSGSDGGGPSESGDGAISHAAGIARLGLISARSNHGWTPLLRAACGGRSQALAWLFVVGGLDPGAATAQGPSGFTAMHWAARAGSRECCDLLDRACRRAQAHRWRAAPTGGSGGGEDGGSNGGGCGSGGDGAGRGCDPAHPRLLVAPNHAGWRPLRIARFASARSAHCTARSQLHSMIHYLHRCFLPSACACGAFAATTATSSSACGL